MGQLRLLVVDDHQLMLEAVRSALGGEDEIEIVGEARSGHEALVLARDAAPDIVLLDLRMPGMDGIQVLEELKKRFPAVRVVALSGSDDGQLTSEVLARGASAFVSKSLDPRDLAAVLRQVVEGTVTSGGEQGVPRSERAAREAGLTEREAEVLGWLAEGRSNKQIALELRVSEQAVKYHLTNVYRKLRTSGRVEALRRATELGLVDTRSSLSL
jgi:DNA-binding NarL/FixJ family response regulator